MFGEIAVGSQMESRSKEGWKWDGEVLEDEEQTKQATPTSSTNLGPRFGREVASCSTAPASSRQHLISTGAPQQRVLEQATFSKVLIAIATSKKIQITKAIC
jgi:hypothetical protein